MPESQEQLEVGTAPKRAAGFVLTEDDITILKLIYEFRFLRREHITLLTGRHTKSVHRRLSKLSAAHYLSVTRLPLQKHIYGLAKRALTALVERGIGTPELLLERVRTHELKELFLKHEMMLVELHIMLTLATSEADGSLHLVQWKEGRELWDSVFVVDGATKTKLPVRPDALFTIEDSRRPAGANRISYFLEADRSTATQTRFRDKIRAYWQYREQGLHARKFGIKTFRVLTVALTDERAENLCSMTALMVPEGGRKVFFFAALKKLSLDNPASVLSDIYLSARSCGSGIRGPLIPPPAAL